MDKATVFLPACVTQVGYYEAARESNGNKGEAGHVFVGSLCIPQGETTGTRIQQLVLVPFCVSFLMLGRW